MPRSLAAALLALLVSTPLVSAHGQRVLLQIKPGVGDTLHTRLEQAVEVTGTMRVGNADSSLSTVTSLRLHSRVIVQRSDAGGTTVLAITDSVTLTSEPPQLPQITLDQVQRALRGQQVRMRIAPDGAAEILTGTEGFLPEIQSLMSQMPPTLPDRRIAIGERWVQDMELPAGRPDLTGPLSLKATLRLDSLSRDRRMAYISVRGDLSRTESQLRLPGGGQYRMTGVLRGQLIVDRDRGWMMESSSELSVSSIIEPPPGAEGEPMHLQMRITQRMWTLDKR
ncbi:MAG TPA: hypothetical protein VMM18_08030 [Gemmatimonadaceae bacterium]|nr:hypothetical protein [Gemmatimonadaceae bacterium]